MIVISPISNCVGIPSAVLKLLYDYKGRKDRQIDMEELLGAFLQHFIASVLKKKRVNTFCLYVNPAAVGSYGDEPC